LGDEVLIKVPESTLLGGTLLIYGVPLSAGVCLSVAAAQWGDVWSAVAFAGGLLAAFAILRIVSLRAGGVLPGLAEPRLAARSANQVEDLLVKS
jgi:positive regulator of sigma E activity